MSGIIGQKVKVYTTFFDDEEKSYIGEIVDFIQPTFWNVAGYIVKNEEGELNEVYLNKIAKLKK